MKISLSQITKRGRRTWVVSWKPPTGKRQRRFFHSKAQGEACRHELATQQQAAGTAWLGLTAEQRNEIAMLVARAQREGFELRDAVDFFLEHRGASERACSIGGAFQRFLAEKQSLRLAPKTLAALRSNIGRFVQGREEQPLASVRREDVQAWLQQPDWSPRTFNTYLTSLTTFFRWAVAAELLAKSPASSLRKIGFRQMPDIDEPPAILTIEQCRHLLKATLDLDPALIPYVAMCLFAGLRPEREAGSLSAGDIEPGYINVRGMHAKDRQRRRVPIHPTLQAWLDKGGDLPPKNLRRRCEAVRESAGLIRRNPRAGSRAQIIPTGWAQDCMRHTFASNYLPVFGVEATVEALGHGDYAMLFRHYRSLVGTQDAMRFWDLTPAAVLPTNG